MDKQKKTVLLRFRCTPGEKKILLQKAEKYKSFSHYVRNHLLKKESRGVDIIPPTETIRIIDSIVFELKKVGVNINQIAKYINQRKGECSNSVLEDYNLKLQELVDLEKELDIRLKKIINNV